MGSVDDAFSWDERVDYALGQAANVLEHAESNVVDVADAVDLARAWRSLARDWMTRQIHAVEIEYPDEEVDDDETEGAEHGVS